MTIKVIKATGMYESVSISPKRAKYRAHFDLAILMMVENIMPVWVSPR